MNGMFGIAGAAYMASKQVGASVSASKDAARANSQVSQLKGHIRMLQANVAKALMINEALWEIVRDNMELTEHELHQKVHEVDMRDGTLDGKNQRKAVECPSCHHMVSSRHPACLYCGKVIDDSVFSMG